MTNTEQCPRCGSTIWSQLPDRSGVECVYCKHSEPYDAPEAPEDACEGCS